MKKSPAWRVGVVVCLAGLMMASGAGAAVCQVSATVVSFGSFSPLTLDLVDSTGNITVNCTDVAGYSITLSAGNGSYSQRSLLSGGHALDYNLYRDAARQQVWGDGISGGSYAVTLSSPVNGQNHVHTVYGRLPLTAARGAPVGTYTDTIAIVIDY